MANIYGVGVMNRYELFVDDESDPLDVFGAMERLREEKKKAKLADKENSVVVRARVAPTKKANPPQENRNPKPNVEKENRRNDYNQTEEEPARGASPRRGRPLANRNGGRRAADERRGKREFDRQSGSDRTGVKPVDKRDGAGVHNWGSHRDLIEEVERARPEEPADEGDAEEAPIVEEVRQLTLEEWRASRANRAKPQYNTRKAGEGEDPAQWRKMYVLSRKPERDESEDDDEYDPSEFPQRVGRLKHVRDINFYFNDGRRGGTFRGKDGRGRRDGRQHEGDQCNGDQPASGAGPAPRVDDERAFPSLA